jgi:hypothetical protein
MKTISILFSFCFLVAEVSSYSQLPLKPVNNMNAKNNDTVLKTQLSGIELKNAPDFYMEPRSVYNTDFKDLYFGPGEDDSTGIYTFRGNYQRNSPVRGTLSGRPSEITGDWIFTTGSDTTNGLYGVWGGGAGWTGQPLFVTWTPEELKNADGLMPEFRNRNTVLREIIQVSLCGKIYFIDLESGKATRKPLDINNPIKGTPSLDAITKRYLFSGQGIQNRGNFAWRIFDIEKQSLIHTEIMPSSFAKRMWGASDASPLIDGKNKFFVWPTESGVFYRGRFSEHNIPVPEEYRYSIPQHPKLGTESSPAAYKYLGYFTDNNGNVFCLDMRTMHPVWYFFNTDDTDGSPVIETEGDIPYLYIGNEVDLQGPSGMSHLRKLNGLTGKLIWEYERTCYNVTKPKTDNGGMLCTPAVGIKKAKGLVWTIFSRVDQYGRGSFVCLNTSDGKVKYEIPMKSYSWVSPIAMYDNEGNPYIYFGDVSGNIYLIDGISGEIIFKKNLEYIFESSPVAIGNRIIQPARGNRILSFIVR